VNPSTTTTYTLTATNAFGSATATATLTEGLPPVINSFFSNPNVFAGPGVSGILYWTTTNATSVTIDHNVGSVNTAGSTNVSPSATTTYTLTAKNSAGSVTATATVAYIPLVTVNSQLYYSEHSIYIIPPASQVTWTGNDSWDSVYSTANVNSYVSTLKNLFPSDYFFVAVAANNLLPNNVPSVLTYRHLADGIGENSITGTGVPNICRYNIGGGDVIIPAFGVLDHEIGHNWGVFIGGTIGSGAAGDLGMGHWIANSTATGQMKTLYTDDGYATIKQISGTPETGFTWSSMTDIQLNQTEVFSDQDLYLQGLSSTFPDVYVLDSPVYNANHTVTYSSVTKYDQAWVVQNNGVRSPSYQTSEKKHRMGFIYVARNKAEVLAAYQAIELSANHFTNAEQIDNVNYEFQVPYLVETHYRASVDALLADLDGNATPTLSITGPTYLTSADGSALVPYVAADSDGPAPTVSCVPASTNCSVTAKNIVLTGLASGTNFFTIKAQDAGGKKAFAHFVVDVQ
jgi:hypothetical protein